MSKIRTILITAVVVLPMGAFADMMLRGHPHLQRAHHALHEAMDEIIASQRSNERIWGDEGGHGQKAKENIERAMHQIDEAAEWVNHHEH